MSPNLNIFVAPFTTCWARLPLYEALELLGERVLYYDTDSVIYVEEEGQPNPVLGDYLGEFTSELDDDDTTEEFVLAGPKNYGYKTKKGHVECKVSFLGLQNFSRFFSWYLVLCSATPTRRWSRASIILTISSLTLSDMVVVVFFVDRWWWCQRPFKRL